MSKTGSVPDNTLLAYCDDLNTITFVDEEQVSRMSVVMGAACSIASPDQRWAAAVKSV